jgi:hypothetical protein
MSELDDAMTRLAAAVARLEAAASHPQRPAEDQIADDQTAAIAETVAARLDAALARLGRLLDRED